MINYKIILFKHGYCENSDKGIYIASKLDYGLSTYGKNNLLKLKSSYEYEDVHKVYTSPMKRCVETKEILYKDKFCEELDELTDLDMGNFEGETISSLEKDIDYIKWIGDTKNNTPPNGESFKSFQDRVENALNYIIMDMMKNKVTKVSVITHGMVLMSMLTRFGTPEMEPFRWMIGSGKGVVILVNAMLWSRDKKFEVAGVAPYGLESFE
ncbi:MAG: histidine phosphatase family protein [Oscillospiraceae bacterium]